MDLKVKQTPAVYVKERSGHNYPWEALTAER